VVDRGQSATEEKRNTAWLAKTGLRIALTTAVIAFLSSVAAFWSAFNSYRAVENARLSSQGALLFQMTQTFFYTEPHKKIIRRLEEREKLRVRTKGGVPISDEDLDDHIGFLDTLGTYVKTNVLDCKLVEPVFGHYVESAFESKEIQQYLNEVKNSKAADFADFAFLYGRMKKKCAND
jgi:hypothetical protein